MKKQVNPLFDENKLFWRIMKVVVEKGPSLEFWLTSFILSSLFLVVWFMLKAIGIINTPLWIRLLPSLGAIVVILTFCGNIGFIFFKGGRFFQRLLFRLTVLEQDMAVVKQELKDFRQEYKEHLVKYH